MTRFMGLRRLIATVAGVASMVALLGASAPAVGLLGQTAHAASSQQSVYTFLRGTWLGRGLGDAGGCGTEYGQYTFFTNQEFSYTTNSEDCAAFTLAGYYRIQNGIFTEEWVVCSFACRPGYASSRFAIITHSAIEFSDSGGAYLYHRD
jgi:hypothetical protein